MDLGSRVRGIELCLLNCLASSSEATNPNIKNFSTAKFALEAYSMGPSVPE